MSKLKLNIEDLKVESFTTSENMNKTSGTVKGQVTTTDTHSEITGRNCPCEPACDTGYEPCVPTNPYWESCAVSQCVETCETCGETVCGNSCDLSCYGYTCNTIDDPTCFGKACGYNY